MRPGATDTLLISSMLQCDRSCSSLFFFFFQAEDGIRDDLVTGVQTCALPISASRSNVHDRRPWIGCRRVEAAPGEFERLLHESMVGGREHYFSMRRARLVPGFFTSSMASRRSEERRVGKECSSGLSAELSQTK